MVYEIQTIIRLMIETWMIVLWMIVSYPTYLCVHLCSQNTVASVCVGESIRLGICILEQALAV